VEGHELNVFLGGAQTIRRDRPFVQFESTVTDQRTQDIFHFFRSLGYSGVLWLGETGVGLRECRQKCVRSLHGADACQPPCRRQDHCVPRGSTSLHELRMLKRSAPRTVARCGAGIRSILFTLCSWKCLRIFLRSNALYASYCKLWLNLGHGHGSPAERKMAMVIGWPLLKLNASTRGPRSKRSPIASARWAKALS
jgi:hypothetical protein